MIEERAAREHYSPGTTEVIRKGDPRWRSDHPERRGEKHVYNPTSAMTAGIQRRSAAEKDLSALDELTDTAPVGSRISIPNGRDLVTVELRENADGRYWHTCFTQKNGAL